MGSWNSCQWAGRYCLFERQYHGQYCDLPEYHSVHCYAWHIKYWGFEWVLQFLAEWGTVGGTPGFTFDVSSGSAAINKTGTGIDTIAAVLTLNDNLVINSSSSAAAYLNVSGAIGESGSHGVTVSSGWVDLGNAASTYTGGTTVNSGAFVTVTVANGLGSTSGSLTVDGSLFSKGVNLTVGSLNGASSGLLRNGFIANTVTLTIGSGNASGGIYAGALGTAGSSLLAVTKTGMGTQVLSGANTYTGGTTVNAGTLEINGTHSGNGTTTVNGGTLEINGTYSGNGNLNINSGRLIINSTHSGSGLITVSSGATLAGAGTMGNVDIVADGILSPGNSAGTITLANLTLDISSALNVELDEPEAASDKVVVTGALHLLAGPMSLNVSGLPGLAAQYPAATQWLVMEYGSLGAGSDLGYLTLNNTTGLALELDVSKSGQVWLVAVPEPAAGALFALALVLLRRRVRPS